MKVKVIKTNGVIKVCPNQAKHIQDIVDKVKLYPFARLVGDFPMRHNEQVFCVKCGGKLIDETIEHTNIVCGSCGEAIDSSDSYCPHCGVGID